MPKKVLQDIIISSRDRRKINENGNNSSRAMPTKDTKGKMPSMSSVVSHELTYANVDSNNRFSRYAIWGVAVVAVFFLLFALLSVFSGTLVKVTPLQKSVAVDEYFTAMKDSTPQNLSFKLVVLENSLSGKVSATEEKRVEQKASGSIVIYNAYSSQNQKLIKRTRFETPEGGIYRINKSVVVPGTTVQDGKIVPGSIEVTVYADIPGKEYNIGLTDFTIPGFKGEPRFDKFYARSKTSIEGGFSGVVKTASLDDIAQVKEELQNSLKETLLTQARSQVPGDFILYDDAVFFSFGTSDNLTETKKDMIEITENGILYGVLFNKKELSKNIAENTVAIYDGEDVFVQELEKLEFSVKDKEGFSPTQDSEIVFSLSGIAEIVWEIDETSIARNLAGVDKSDFLEVVSEYPNVQKSKATLRPFWKKTFPENSEEITIRVVEQESL